jgi:hypothetical protein
MYDMKAMFQPGTMTGCHAQYPDSRHILQGKVIAYAILE